MTGTATLKIPAPTRDAHVELATRFRLGVALDGIEIIYDYNRANGSIYLRVLNEPAQGTITERMDADAGIWLAVCSVDEAGLNPINPEVTPTSDAATCRSTSIWTSPARTP